MRGKEIDQLAKEATVEQQTVPIMSLLCEAVEDANFATYGIDVLRVVLFGGEERGLNEPKKCENVKDAVMEIIKYLKAMNEMLAQIYKGVMP